MPSPAHPVRTWQRETRVGARLTHSPSRDPFELAAERAPGGNLTTASATTSPLARAPDAAPPNAAVGAGGMGSAREEQDPGRRRATGRPEPAQHLASPRGKCRREHRRVLLDAPPCGPP